MTSFQFAHSDAGPWSAIAKALAAGLASPRDNAENGDAKRDDKRDDKADDKAEDSQRLGFLYVTDVIAEDVGSILAYLRQATGVEEWVGSVGIGICASGAEYFDRPAAAAMIASLPRDSFMVFPAITEAVGEIPAKGRAWIEKTSPPFGIVHGDPTAEGAAAMVETMALATQGFLVGGLTSSRGPQHQIAGRVVNGGLSGVLFAPAVEVATGLSQGCVPLGPAHRVTECLENVIIELDGQKALEVFKADVGELLARDLNRASGYIHAAFPVEGSDTGDYLVRNLVGIDPLHGWLAVGAEVATGDRVMFVRRDPKSAIEDLTAMIRNLKNRLPGRPKGGVYFSCVARGPNMFGKEGDEMALIREQLGDVPLVGFYGNGEISNNRLYGYTGVLALFL
ncbi:MAG TPA: FIST N-terminal domain-containing protein [Rhodospirillales bacterium]